MSRRPPWVLGCAAVAMLAVAGVLYVPGGYLHAATVAVAMAVAALGLTVLSGHCGQISLGHAFFMALGAYAYTALATPSDPARHLVGAGLPSAVAGPLAVVACGIAGAAFSTISGRVSGLNLAIVSLATVFLGNYLVDALVSTTGGANGRSVPALDVGGLRFADGPDRPSLWGVPLGASELQWLLCAGVAGLVFTLVRNHLRFGSGQAMRAVRDGELAAASVGIDVRRVKREAFIVSSCLAGLGGILLALVLGYLVPDLFGMQLSIDVLAIVVIGGQARLAGALIGAAVVSLLPNLLAIGSGLSDSTTLARYLYGAVFILVLRFAPGGLASLAGHRGGSRLRSSQTSPNPPARTQRGAESSEKEIETNAYQKG